MASGLFNSARQKFINGDIDWNGDDVECLLVDDVYAFDETDEFVSDLVASEIGVSGYSRQNVTTRTASDATSTVIDCDDVAFGVLAAGETIGGAVLFVNDGVGDSSSPLICFIDVTDLVTGYDTTLVIPATGVFNWSG